MLSICQTSMFYLLSIFRSTTLQVRCILRESLLLPWNRYILCELIAIICKEAELGQNNCNWLEREAVDWLETDVESYIYDVDLNTDGTLSFLLNKCFFKFRYVVWRRL